MNRKTALLALGINPCVLEGVSPAEGAQLVLDHGLDHVATDLDVLSTALIENPATLDEGTVLEGIRLRLQGVRDLSRELESEAES